MADKKRFLPIKGLKERVLSQPIVEGQMLITTDTKEIFLDAGNNERLLIGRSGVTLFYAFDENVQVEDSSAIIYYSLSGDFIENFEHCQPDDLILNTDGCFYKIQEVLDNEVICLRLSVSGTGGGGGGTGGSTVRRGRVSVTNLGEVDILNGDPAQVSITVTSMTEDDDPIETVINADIVLYTFDITSNTFKEFHRETRAFNHGQTIIFDATNFLRQSSRNKITCIARPSEGNVFTLKEASTEINTHKLNIEWNDTIFSNLNYFESGKIQTAATISQGVRRVYDLYFDDNLIFIGKYDTSSFNNPSSADFEITASTKILDLNGNPTGETLADYFTHGSHVIKAKLSLTKNDGTRGNGTDFIEKEIAIKADASKPLIWIGNLKNTYYEYDTILVPFRVYDPLAGSEGIQVHLYRNGVEIEGSPRAISTGSQEWSYWEIVDLSTTEASFYTIRVGKDENEVSRVLSFEILPDPRNMQSVPGAIVSFDSRGRSNNEEASRRQTLEIPGLGKATFTNFNWYNNGWVFDENRVTCLRISNGASFSIPVGPMIFQGSGDKTTRHTIEFQFKLNNISNYDKLVTNYTRYKVEKTGWTDDAAFQAFLDQRSDNNGYTNYDAFLANYYLNAVPDSPSYDDLEFDRTYKMYNFDSVIFSYAAKGAGGALDAQNPGIYVGPQDAFFTNGTNTVTTNFVEDELINLSFVFTGGTTASGGELLMEVFMNGVLTSIARSTLTSPWTINAQTIDFNSSACDIDLYKIRTYDTALSIPDIVQNYAFDLKDTTMWDQKDLAFMDNTLGEYRLSYKQMLEYNKAHPLEPLMPYIILRTTNENSQNRLPYVKSTKVTGGFEFVNTALDAAYNSGELAQKAIEAGMTVEEYYVHHCPSFTSEIDKVELTVQGTSSQFYPRRNYKAKFKYKYEENNEEKEKILMYLHQGPFQQAYSEDPESTRQDQFFMDNYTVGTDRFTLKVDYMESSGDYNRGFANLVASTYSKHPIQDYGSTAFEGYDLYGDISDYRTSVKGYPVLAFHQPDDREEPIFIGKYNMLLDKGSDACYGFKPNKKVKHNFLDGLRVRDVAECWEFQNNSRGYCSFRDPWLRKELSFEGPAGFSNEEILTADEAPIVADSFEYRYSSNEDVIDRLIDIKGNRNNQADILKDFTDSMPYKITVTENEEGDITEIRNSKGQVVDITNSPDTARQLMLDLFSNWEKAVAWVWSTAVDTKVCFEAGGPQYDIPSIGSYNEVALGTAKFEPGVYYITSVDNEYQLAQEWNSDLDYYERVNSGGEISYRSIVLTNDENKVYVKNKFFIKENPDEEIYVLSSEDNFDAGQTYYSLIKDESLIDDMWLLPEPVTYGGEIFTKDSIEYRQAKFRNELKDHFDIEYLATYFLMTEIFECYDSRGKNCMMASWGPQKEGGEFIWYPIFYDIDTQLGINNTGIPSFEYYTDATEDGSFSTNDSVLWNNFFRFFRGTIINKYKQLMDTDNPEFTKRLEKPLFKSDKDHGKINLVDRWYMSDPEITGSYAMKGDRPLVAINLDEYYKYITPTNIRAKDTIFGRISDKGEYVVEPDTYFYALQGDRHLYRKQFLENRLNYIDSWLTLDDYARGGANRIRSRISANNPTTTSDRWIEGTATNGAVGLITNSQYWKNGIEYGEKNHEFDGEYWITMTPIRNSYVTVGTDTANFPSQKFTGAPVKFSTPDLENGIVNSGNYREQLYYVYGLSQMKSLGDLSKLYFQEFEITGNAHKMSDLLLGYDGLDESGSEYYNKGVNDWAIPAGKNAAGMPLLKEVNLSNITFKNNNLTFDFSSCEKLENFRNTGSNISQVTFAPGVALNTLYLTDTTTTLNLVEARLLTKLIRNYVYPVKNTVSGKLEVQPENKGLYIKNLTDISEDENLRTNLLILSIEGGGLGYYSYELLDRYYKACENASSGADRKVSLTKVQWGPYVAINDPEFMYSADEQYFVDNGHFQLEPYEFTTQEEWVRRINNKVLYRYDDTISGMNDVTEITDLSLLDNLLSSANKNRFIGISETSICPNISGLIYVNNSTPIKEADIQNIYISKFPNLKIFCNNVEKGYSARFIIDHNNIETLIASQKISKEEYQADNSIFFNSPVTYSIGDIKNYMPNYDFKGWATDPQGDNMIIETALGNDLVYNPDSNLWDALEIQADVYDYTFYAIFEIHRYRISFYDYPEDTNPTVMYIPYGEQVLPPNKVPSKGDDGLDFLSRYGFKYYTAKINSSAQVDFSREIALADKDFYAYYQEENVYDSVLDEKYLEFNNNNEKLLKVKDGVVLKGKITLPKTLNGVQVVGIARQGFYNQNEITHVFWEDGECPIDYVSDSAFRGCYRLKYFELAGSSEGVILYGSAFDTSQGNNDSTLFQNVSEEYQDIFFANIKGLYGASLNRALCTRVKFSSKVRTLTPGAFSNCPRISFIQFGEITQPCGEITMYVNDSFVFYDAELSTKLPGGKIDVYTTQPTLSDNFINKLTRDKRVAINVINGGI